MIGVDDGVSFTSEKTANQLVYPNIGQASQRATPEEAHATSDNKFPLARLDEESQGNSSKNKIVMSEE